jgi:hypothetical protein
MAGWRQAVELAMTEEEIAGLATIARSRIKAARRVEREQMLLAYRKNPSFFAVGQSLSVHHRTNAASRAGAGLSGQHRDQVDPRQSFRAHL